MPEPQPTTGASDRFATRAVAAAMALTVLLLFVMLISSFITSQRLGKMNEQQALTIDVYGHQWWWEVQYPNEAEPYRMVTTANEIHVPVGTPIRIHGTSRDVIHSFWAPNIQGKRDLMPGYNTDVLMQVDQARPLARTVRRVLRHAACAHVVLHGRGVAEGLRQLDDRAGAKFRSCRTTRRRSTASRYFSPTPASFATPSAAPLPARVSGPT